MDLNNCNFVGRLADDVRYYAAEGDTSSRVTGRLMINRVPGNDGQRRADAIPFVAWGRQADAIARYTAKGKELAIAGELRTNSIPPSKEGEPWRNFFEILVRTISFGRDSNQQKMMKAIQGVAAGAPADQVRAVIGALQPGTTDINQLLQDNPTFRQTLEQLAQPAAAAQAAEVAEEPATEEEATEAPFQE